MEPCPALAGAPEGRGPIRVPYNAVVLVAFAGIIAAAIGFASILAVTVAFLAGAVAAGIAAIAAPVALPLSACYDSLLTPRGIAGRYPLLTATAGTPAS